MTLDELKAKLPEPFKPWAETYGPAFLAMTADEVKAWIELLIRGKGIEAYEAVLKKLPATELLSEWDTLKGQWAKANENNAERMSLQKAASVAALKILLTVALAAVGL